MSKNEKKRFYENLITEAHAFFRSLILLLSNLKILLVDGTPKQTCRRITVDDHREKVLTKSY